jgi:hypothetical protein
MRAASKVSTGLLIAGILITAVRLPAQEQNTNIQTKGLPPRATPADYQAHAQAGMVTIAAEFVGHAVPTPEQTLSSEDYIVVEAGLFGSPDARTTLSRDDFSLRINGKKTPSPSQPYELVFQSLKDPEWIPPEPAEPKSKGGLSTGGGGGGGNNLPPVPPKMPFPMRRAMEQHVQKAAMQEGDRALPQAGLLFFQYRGKTEGIKSLELKATLELQP